MGKDLILQIKSISTSKPHESKKHDFVGRNWLFARHSRGLIYVCVLLSSSNDEHEELLAEMELIERLPTQERLRQAKRRRALQIKRWQEYEREMQMREQQLQHHQNHVNQNGAIKSIDYFICMMIMDTSLELYWF